jgi:hypothetical protein
LVQLHFFVDNSVQIQNERRNRIGLVGRKSSRSRIRHRAIYVIPDGRRIRPVAAHRPHRILAPQRALASGKPGILQHSLTAISVAVRAERLIDTLSLCDRAASLGQARAIRRHGDIEFANFFGRRRSSQFVLMEFFILLDDDSTTATLGTQLGDIRQFILTQPSSTKIGVAYMRNGIAWIAQQPTSDHALAAKALRLPLAMASANGSPYFSLSDLVKRWPKSNSRREVLMISDGYDRYYGQNDLLDPYLDATINEAQRAGIVVSTLYNPGVGTYGRGSFSTYIGQVYLGQVADRTGGEAYYIGFNRPAVAFAPFLNDLSNRLKHQYLLSFLAEPEKKSGLEPVKLVSEVPNMELVAADRVYVRTAR